MKTNEHDDAIWFLERALKVLKFGSIEDFKYVLIDIKRASLSIEAEAAQIYKEKYKGFQKQTD